jgi:hypothetical protein
MHQEPLRYKELFKDLVYGRIPERPMPDWDNQADGIEMPDVATFEQCASECEQNTGCFQASYDGKDCTLGTRSFRLGVKREPEGNKKWQSIWIKKRMLDFTHKHAECTGYEFVFHDAFVCK